MANCHGTLDVVVHFHRFRNVDLFSRGIYMVRVSAQTMSSKQVGIPYSYYSKPSTLSTFVRNQEIPCAHAATLPAAQIVNETSEFSTRAFVIKYRDERLDLNEGCQFQLLLESRAEPRDDSDEVLESHRLVFERGEPVSLQIDLLMAELEKPPDERGNAVAAEKPSASPVFTRIASQTLCVVCDPASQQLHAYYPVTFSAMHFCQLDMTVHTALINLKFRKRAYSRPEADNSKNGKNGKAPAGSAGSAASSGVMRSASSLMSSMSVGPQKPVQQFHQLLFPDHDEDQAVDPDRARAIHHAYLQPMLQSLGATAAALRNMCTDGGGDDGHDTSVPSSRAVAGVMALIKKPYLEGSPFNGIGFGGGRQAKPTQKESDETLTPDKVANCIEADIKLVARRLFLLWGRFVAMLPQEQPNSHSGRGISSGSPSVVGRLQRTWLSAQRRWWGSRLRNHHVRVQKILQPRETDELDVDFQDLRSSRGNAGDGPKMMLSIYDHTMLKDPKLLPVCASHIYIRRDQPVPPGENNVVETPVSSSASSNGFPVFTGPATPGIPAFDDAPSYRGPHLIVMQHGWYASSFDMRLLRAYALLLFPRAIVLSPQSNEDNTGGSMGPMGQRLAHEVHNFIKHRCGDIADPDPDMGRISFIGHSAGSMIVRTALTSPIFKPYLPKLHAFVSLSSSHCGNMFVPSTIISGGMWALQHLHQSQFMNELQLIDADDMQDSFMYKLSQSKGFEYFRYVVLVGSTQDCYVPMHTAHATIPRPAETDKKGDGSAYMQMAANLMKPITQKTPNDPKQTTVIRITLDHKFTQTNLDTVIGRAAHLAYIDSSSAVCLVLFSLYNLLK
ncbi:hypothetical protein CTAYLR_007762 [Chrysophaeum taylorii]|uniref:DUF676 domain-containing protein n=1 Tax=Chrysophaeum taylorii TaxID=2483200 RepID=A0AAD7UMR1_9STRA|nr:hypothetical protein CTAYLR_007762 [Chrysophaeum taylorii]